MVKGCVTQQVTVFLHEMGQVVMSCQEVCCLHQHWFFTHDADDVTCELSQISCQNKKCIQNFHNLPFTIFFFLLRYKSFSCTYFKEVWTIKEMCHNQSIPAYFYPLIITTQPLVTNSSEWWTIKHIKNMKSSFKIKK